VAATSAFAERVQQVEQSAPAVEPTLLDELAGTARSVLFLRIEHTLQHAEVEPVLRSGNRVVLEQLERYEMPPRATRTGKPAPISIG
jgi:hypothetical protein